MKFLALLFLLSCTLTTEPVYLTGDASYIVIAGPADTVRATRAGGADTVAFPGESLCVHFRASSHIETFWLSSTFVPLTIFMWLPAERYPGAVFALSGNSIFTSIETKRC